MQIDTNGIELEDVIEDRVTGFRGKAAAFAQHITGCARVGIQGRLDKDGKVPDMIWADVLTCTVVTPITRFADAGQTIAPASKGGPQRGEPRSRFG